MPPVVDVLRLQFSPAKVDPVCSEWVSLPTKVLSQNPMIPDLCDECVKKQRPRATGCKPSLRVPCRSSRTRCYWLRGLCAYESKASFAAPALGETPSWSAARRWR